MKISVTACVTAMVAQDVLQVLMDMNLHFAENATARDAVPIQQWMNVK